MLNQVILIGRLVAEPELRYTPGDGVAVADFTLAVDRPFANKDTGEREADFIKVIVWRGQAEACSKHLQKGQMAAVVGRLQVSSFDDKDGVRRKVAEVIANNVQFLSRPKGEGSAEPAEGDDYPS